MGAAVGVGVGGALMNSGATTAGAAAVGGAAGGAAGGALGTALAGGDMNAVGKSAIVGAVSGAVGGAVGVYAGSQSSNAGTAFGGSMVGTAYGTAAGMAVGALAGENPSVESFGISLATAFQGAVVGAALSNDFSAASDGRAASKSLGGFGQGHGEHDIVVCDTSGNPACGDWQARDARLGKSGERQKQVVGDFANAPSPQGSAWEGLTVGQAALARIRPGEHQAFIIQNKRTGIMRLSEITASGDSSKNVNNIPAPHLNDNEIVIGTIHSHPGRDNFNGYFSNKDKAGFADLRRVHRTLNTSILIYAAPKQNVFSVSVHEYQRNKSTIYNHPAGKW